MSVLVTGVAGFIGMHVAEALLARGEAVVGIDTLDAAYDPALKAARLRRLVAHERFAFVRGDAGDPVCLADWAERRGGEATGIVHLAVSSRSRWPLRRPLEDARRRLSGHLVLLELCRRLPLLRHLVYALPCPPLLETEHRRSAGERHELRPDAEAILSRAFARLHRIPQTGLRLGGVYGPWSRPDTLCHVLADAIAAGRPVSLREGGRQLRLAFVGDVAARIVAALDRPPASEGGMPHRLLDLTGQEPVEVEWLVTLLEDALGGEVEKRWQPAPAGEAGQGGDEAAAPAPPPGTPAGIGIEEGIARFAAWYRDHRSHA
jgi:UDP-glucuronate 4-epimerase